MSNYRIIDIENWNRKEHFEFFSQFDEPFFGIVSEIDCTRAYKIARQKGVSLFAWYLHKSLAALNEIEELRCRVDGDKVVVFDKVNASATIGRDDGTFSFSFIPFETDFEVFDRHLKKEIEKVRNSVGLRFSDETKRIDVVHCSSLPWSKFTGLTHARNFKFPDSAPKVTYGKIYEAEGKKMMAVSINAHHGLVDGLHVSKFLALFQKLMDE